MMSSHPEHEYQGWGYHYQRRTIGKKKILFRIAGLLLILGGIISVLNGLSVFMVGHQVESNEIPLVTQYCAMTSIVLGIISIGGGRITAHGYSWKVSLVVALICICSIGFLFISTACGIIALVLIIFGKGQVVYIPMNS